MSTTPRQQLVILGASTFAEEVADLAADLASVELVAFVEGLDRERCKRQVAGLPVLWIDEVAPLAGTCRAVCGVGSTRRKALIQKAHSLGLDFTTLVHPTAHVSRTASLGAGTIVSAGAVVAAHARIGQHVVINRGSLIGHHSEIGDYVTIGPGANLAGSVRVADQAYIAMGAIVLDHLSVGRQSVVGAGAVVTRPVADRTQVVGMPATVSKENINGL